MALPIRFKNGMNQRAEHYGEAWKRIGNAFPELEVWFVDVENDVYEEHKWKDWPTVSFRSLPFEDAVSLSPDKETSEPSQYTEEFHLEQCNEEVKAVYTKLKQQFLEVKSSLKLGSTRNYIGVVDRKRIAYIQPKGKKVHLIVLMAEDEVKEVLQLRHHEVVSFSKSRQRTWGGKNPSCAVNIYDTDNWDEIQKLVTRLVEKYQEA